MAITMLASRSFNAEPCNTAPIHERPKGLTDSQEVQRWQSGSLSATQDMLIEETPVALCYNGISHLVMMVSPVDLEDFALGFSLSEGILESADELFQLDRRSLPEGIELNLTIAARRQNALQQGKRNLTGRTGCGLCGTDSLQNAIRPVNRVKPSPGPVDTAIQRATAQLAAHQPLHALTGAVHGAAWCSLEGEILLLREDVGRHNALDKLIGALARSNTDYSRGFLLMSSRASYEIVHKAAAAGIGHLVAVSAPTALAIRVANQAGISVTGFARKGSHVHYE